ncbi:MAG: 30S ribosomal protein S6 [Planctomycetota bacterium]
MTQLYETLVLLDNDVVRKDWKQAKAVVKDTITKYDGDLKSCRRWDERRLAYPIKRKNRATYFIAYHGMDTDRIPGFLRDLELNERVLRHMMVKVDDLPEKELELAAEEDGVDFVVEAPPEDDAIEIPEEDENDENDNSDVPDAPPEANADAPAPKADDKA